jgi:hypothetical protein
VSFGFRRALTPSVRNPRPSAPIPDLFFFSRRLLGTRRAIAANLPEEPGASVSPISLSRCRRDAEGLSGLFDGKPSEVAQLDQLGLGRVEAGQFLESLIERDQVLPWPINDQLGFVKLVPYLTTAALQGGLVASVFDENAPHGLGRGREKVSAPRPMTILTTIDEPNVRLVDEGGCAQCLSGLFSSHLVSGKAAQLVVDHRQQLASRVWVTPVDRFQNSFDLVHEL